MADKYLSKKNIKGFTLAEMLIVVAIIAVLVAIITPSLTKNLEKSREASDMANIRNAYSMLMNALLDDSDVVKLASGASVENGEKLAEGIDTFKVYYIENAAYPYVIVVEIQQKTAGWGSVEGGELRVGNIDINFDNLDGHKYFMFMMNDDVELSIDYKLLKK